VSAGCRAHLLVLPSVVCATRAAADIADALGAVTITHQHGCSQVGDDGVRTRVAFGQIASNPNVAAALIVGLGCETVQGRSLTDDIRALGQRAEFVGIQESGGSRETVRRGLEVGRELLLAASLETRPPVSVAAATIGFELSHPSSLADAFMERARDAGAAVVLADVADAPRPSTGPIREAAFGTFERTARSVALTGAGRGAQQHVALAAAGVHVIVAFTALDDAPVGFPICPVIAVAGSSDLHAAIADDFDLAADASVDALWARTIAVLAGEPSAAESRGSRVFALERLAMCM
jgi:altronate dehydratase large subunit